MNRRRQQSKPTFIALLLVMALGACTVINEHRAPPSDFPELKITVNELGFWETQEKCDWSPALVILIGPRLGCAKYDFQKMTCDIYLWVNSILEHELLHCKGYDHIGSSQIRDHWNEWKQSQRMAEK